MSTRSIALSELAERTVPMPKVLVVEGGSVELLGRRKKIGHEGVTIGRSPRCDLCVPDAAVSAVHLRLQVTAEGVLLTDLRSRNGTYINGVRVSQGGQVYLTRPTTIDVGDTSLVFLLGDVEEVPLSEANRFGGLVGASTAMRALFAELEEIAKGASPVLIFGETGTGKELLAHSIHEASPRRRRPFVSYNCSSAVGDAGLIRADLFGHERGAFTGANDSRKGVFSEAEGGTLFLDEVGEIPLAVQSLVLRALESGEVRPVGGKNQIVDVRIVAATNADLEVAINQDEFREDLFHRLALRTVAIPPLRARLDDLPLLAGELLRALGRPHITLDKGALAALRKRQWPGNVRELKGVLGRASDTCSHGVITATDVERAKTRRNDKPNEPPPTSRPAKVLDVRIPVDGDYQHALEPAEKAYFMHLLAQHRAIMKDVAKQADLHPDTLRKFLGRLDLLPPSGPLGDWLRRFS